MKRRFYRNENDLDAGVKVFHQGKWDTTGNRYHDQVELYRDGKFIKVVSIPNVYSLRRNNPKQG